MSSRNPNVVIAGGGSGPYPLLQAIKEYTPNIAAVVNMSDSGGSSGSLRDEQGILPPGDARQALVALSTLPDAREMFSFRFKQGKQEGDSLGNLIMAAFTHISGGDFRKAVEKSSQLLQITGRVLPITYDNNQQVLQDGSVRIVGEHIIDEHEINNQDAVISLEPPSKIDDEAREAIEKADIVVIAPGSVYTSLLPLFAVEGVKQAIEATRGKVVAVTNLVTKRGQTDGWHVVDHVKKFEQYIGEGAINTVLYNDEKITPVLLENYAADGDFPVDYASERFHEVTANPLGARLVSKDILARTGNSRPQKTLIRHDGIEVGRQIMRLFYS